MPTDQYVKNQFIGTTLVTKELKSRGWQNSPRINGRLKLQTNPYSYSFAKLASWTDPSYLGIPSGVSGARDYSQAANAASANSYARLRGKLYKGSAALGITLATYNQAATMIRERSAFLTQSATKVMARALDAKHRRAGADVSGMVLEAMFGWQPLLADIHAAAMTAIQLAPEEDTVTARSVEHFSWRIGNQTADSSSWETGNGYCFSRRTVTFLVSNPNLWLAERAGLCNPATIAWDLVPWSFVVNMFSNVGGVVNSISDYLGLSFPRSSHTTGMYHQVTHMRTAKKSSPGFSHGEKLYFARAVGAGVTPPPLIWRVPEVSWGTAAIAMSLATQRCSRVITLLSKK